MLLRRPILAAAGSDRFRRAIVRTPWTRSVVARFVAGDDEDAALTVVRQLIGGGFRVSLDHLGEFSASAESADRAADANVSMLRRIAAAGFAPAAEMSIKLSALGLDLDPGACLARARRVAAAARDAGTTITLDMEDHTRTDATLSALYALRTDFPSTGAVLQAGLRRTESDCRDLAVAGSRVRLCKGAYAEPESVAFTRAADVVSAYRRCLEILMSGPGYPMVATHDPALIAYARVLAASDGRNAGSFELQMLYGVRPDEQRVLAEAGCTVRIYVPYGIEWYGYLMRRLAERPANLRFFLRALASRA
jgi:proline dehydrogenase